MSASGPRVAVLGTGPAGLMAAFELVRAGFQPVLYEKRPAPGWKLLVAGSSGLNVGTEQSLREFTAQYRGPAEHFRKCFEAFSPQQWLEFIEKELGIPTFQGTSRRYFIEGMKAPPLLKSWLARIESGGGRLATRKEWSGLERMAEGRWKLSFADGSEDRVDAAVFALGGGSWEKTENPLRWADVANRLGWLREPFQSSNSGFQVEWPKAFLREAEGLPIKNIRLRSPRGERAGDLVVTAYGLEGTPVYFAGEVGDIVLDLKPDLREEQVLERMLHGREKLSPIRAAAKRLALCEAAQALLFHLTPESVRKDAAQLARRVKAFPIHLRERQPLSEAISSSGGICFSEVDENLEMKRFPGIFLAGEMLDWDAPTGGYLLTACAAQGSLAGRAAARWLLERLKGSGGRTSRE